MNAQRTVRIGGTGEHALSLADVVAVAREGVHVELATGARDRIHAARHVVEKISEENRTVYGITTGFGHLSRVKIAQDQLAALQRNLVRSHAAGTGEPFDEATVRATMLLLANSLSRGHSGVRHEVIEQLMGMLNSNVTPVVPMRGSVGASGDLAPLAHLSLVLIGEGEAWHEGRRLAGAEALSAAGLTPLSLAAKEGLALINGTHVMEAMGALAAHDALVLVRAAEVATAMSLEALLGSFVPLDPRIHGIRPQHGQGLSAERLRALLHDSEINASHADCGRVQDPYTLRCAPQVLGAARDTIAHCRGVFAAELAAVTDNPLIFPGSGDVLTGGNFHGQPLALALDFLAIALAQVASFSERRIYNLMGPHDWDSGPSAMPLFLTPEPGLNSGYMIAQYSAAALVNEIKVLAHPASIDSIPTSAGMEDFVSMGSTAGIKLQRVVEMTRRVIAIELLTAAQGLEFRRPLKPGEGALRGYALVRERVLALTADRSPAPDIEILAQAIEEECFEHIVPEAELGQVDRPWQGEHAARDLPNKQRPVRPPEEPGADRAGRGRH